MNFKVLIVLVFVGFSTFSQNKSISGFVEDANTGEKIPNATIRIENTKYATFTNDYGYYNIVIENIDSCIVVCSYIGYEKGIKKIKLKDDVLLNFKLLYNNSIDSIVVTKNIKIEEQNEMGLLILPVSQIKSIPMLMGEADIMKVFQTMPGVENGSEGKSDLYVRGGNPDENLILLDDVPLYYLNHFGGFISVFNTDAIKSVKMYKGGFPARYGSRLSSVIDVRMKEGNMKKTKSSFSLGVLSTKFDIEGPIVKDKISFFLSGRIFPWYRIIAPITTFSYNQSFGYDFYDINGKINYKINDKNQIFLSLYSGKDDVFFKSTEYNYEDIVSLKWGNKFSALRWNSILTKKIFMNTTFALTSFKYDILATYDDYKDSSFFSYSFNSSINDILLKSTIDYNINKKHKIKTGYVVKRHLFKPGVSHYVNNQNSENNEFSNNNGVSRAIELDFFVENKINLFDFLSINIGGHFSSFKYENIFFKSFQPRILANFTPSDKFSIKASYAEMQQYTHLITSSSMASAVNLWVPADDSLPPSNSKQLSIGFYKTFADNLIEFSVETYYKTSENLICFKEGTLLGGVAENWKNKIETNGKGKSKGIEFLLQKKQGKLTGWIAYTLAKSEVKYENINHGKYYPAKYDRRHNFNFVAVYNLKENISVSLGWKFGSGYPYEMPIARYYTINETYYDYPDFDENASYTEQAYIYSEKNTFRMRAYHRLDISINLSKEKKRGIRNFIFSVYNAYNRQNPYFYYYSNKNNKISLYQVSYFPIIPSISYSFRFK